MKWCVVVIYLFFFFFLFVGLFSGVCSHLIASYWNLPNKLQFTFVTIFRVNKCSVHFRKFLSDFRLVQQSLIFSSHATQPKQQYDKIECWSTNVFLLLLRSVVCFFSRWINSMLSLGIYYSFCNSIKNEYEIKNGTHFVKIKLNWVKAHQWNNFISFIYVKRYARNIQWVGVFRNSAHNYIKQVNYVEHYARRILFFSSICAALVLPFIVVFFFFVRKWLFWNMSQFKNGQTLLLLLTSWNCNSFFLIFIALSVIAIDFSISLVLLTHKSKECTWTDKECD